MFSEGWLLSVRHEGTGGAMPPPLIDALTRFERQRGEDGSKDEGFLLWAILGTPVDPRDFPLALLVLTLLTPAVFAVLAAIARRWEYRADRFALTLTRDPAALRSVFVDFVETNVSDLDPPRVVYYLRYTHPTVPERLDALRRAARDEGIEEEAA